MVKYGLVAEEEGSSSAGSSSAKWSSAKSSSAKSSSKRGSAPAPWTCRRCSLIHDGVSDGKDAREFLQCALCGTARDDYHEEHSRKKARADEPRMDETRVAELERRATEAERRASEAERRVAELEREVEDNEENIRALCKGENERRLSQTVESFVLGSRVDAGTLRDYKRKTQVVSFCVELEDRLDRIHRLNARQSRVRFRRKVNRVYARLDDALRRDVNRLVILRNEGAHEKDARQIGATTDDEFSELCESIMRGITRLESSSSSSSS